MKVNLDEIFDFIRSKQKISEGLDNGGYPFYTFIKGVKKYTDTPTYKGNGILVRLTNSPKLLYVNGAFGMSSTCLFLSVRDETVALPKFVYYYLLANIKKLECLYRGNIMQRVSIADLMKFDVELPDTNTQREVVKDLSLADNIIESKISQNRVLKKVFNNYYIKITRETSSKYWNTTYLKEILTSEMTLLSPKDGIDNLSSDTVIVSRNGDAFSHHDFNKIRSLSGCMCLRINEEQCSPCFLAFTLNCNSNVKKQFNILTMNSSISRLMNTDIGNIQIMLPSIKQQHDFENLYEKYSKLCLKMQDSEKLLVAFHSSLVRLFISMALGHGTVVQRQKEFEDIYSRTSKYSFDEYDKMKNTVFSMLENGRLVQYYNETTHKVMIHEP